MEGGGGRKRRERGEVRRAVERGGQLCGVESREVGRGRGGEEGDKFQDLSPERMTKLRKVGMVGVGVWRRCYAMW